MPDYAGIIILLASLALGGSFGSFAAAMWDRTVRGVPRSTPERSECPNCHYILRWYDNLPILSYLLLRGKCRRCNWNIPLWYWVWEAVGALAGLGVAFWVWGGLL